MRLGYQVLHHTADGKVLGGTQVEMEDRMLLPILFQRHYLKPFKKLLCSLKIRFQCGTEQAFPKSARTVQENKFGIMSQFPYKICLVHIQAAASDNLRESPDAY